LHFRRIPAYPLDCEPKALKIIQTKAPTGIGAFLFYTLACHGTPSLTEKSVKYISAMIGLQAWATYLERTNPSWWQAATQAILG